MSVVGMLRQSFENEWVRFTDRIEEIKRSNSFDESEAHSFAMDQVHTCDRTGQFVSEEFAGRSGRTLWKFGGCNGVSEVSLCTSFIS
jgi:hypothetical protein